MQNKKTIPLDWLFYHSLLLLFGLVIDSINGTLLFLPITGFIVFTFYIFQNWNSFTEKKAWGGIPNLTTTFRLVLLFLVPFLNNNLMLAILATTVVCLDFFDGFLARTLNQITTFGGQLDMETDAFFCLLFSVVISIKYPELQWILIAGSMRYLYKIITTIYSKNTFIEAKKSYARYFAGCYFVSFILFFYTDYSIGKYIISIGNLLVLFSFSISFYDYLKFKKT